MSDRVSKVTVSNSVISIGRLAFGVDFNKCCKLMSVTIPNNVSSIDSDAFWNCDNELLTLRVQKGSYAMKYAKRKGYSIEIVE